MNASTASFTSASSLHLVAAGSEACSSVSIAKATIVLICDDRLHLTLFLSLPNEISRSESSCQPASSASAFRDRREVSTPCALRNLGEDRLEIGIEVDEASRTFVRSATRNGATLKEAGQYIRSLSRIEEQELEMALDDGYSGCWNM
jgi:hypothetical protein